MRGIDYLLLAVIVAILGAVVWFLHKAKKSGKKCIGCPDSEKCGGNCHCH